MSQKQQKIKPTQQPGAATDNKEVAAQPSKSAPQKKLADNPPATLPKPARIVSSDDLQKPQIVAPLILWITGCKGGVGKSTTARILTDLLAEKTEAIAKYDCDSKNPQFKRFYQAKYLPLMHSDLHKSDKALETLATVIEEKQHQYIIIDSPAGEVDALGKLEDRFAFTTNLPLLGAKLTRVFVLSTTPESTNLLNKALVDTKGLPVDHVVVRNLHFGGPEYFTSYNGSETKKQLERQGGITVDLPQLGAIAVASIDDKSLTYQQAMQPDSGFPIMRRSMVMRWREAVRQEFAQAGALLGVS
ncbi:MAG: hypothetical protein AAGE59_13320 [Cyanobacteria bacterium P01_F01_bin.86]